MTPLRALCAHPRWQEAALYVFTMALVGASLIALGRG